MPVPVPSPTLLEISSIGTIKGSYFHTPSVNGNVYIYLIGIYGATTGLWSNYQPHLVANTVDAEIAYDIIAASQTILDNYAAEQLAIVDQAEFNRLWDLGYLYTG